MTGTASPGAALHWRGSPYAGPLEARSFPRPVAFPFAARPGGQMEGVVPQTYVQLFAKS